MSARDKAGELGITEEDFAIECSDQDCPDFAPDTRNWHGYSTLDRVLSYVLTFACGAIAALVLAALLRGLC